MPRLAPPRNFCTAIILIFFCALPAVAQTNSVPAPDAGREMTLADCVRIALKENKTIKSAYLDRIVQKYELRVAEDKFTPKMTITPGVLRASTTNSGAGTYATTTADIVATVSETLPTGATINLTASNYFTNTNTNGSSGSYGWNVSLNQPFLKGGGLDVASASVRTARIAELNNILSLKTTIMDTLTAVITSYRDYVRALKELEISRQSFERGKELVDINRELITAGRMAEIDLVQSEADVASREYNLLAAENSTDAARLALVKVMDIDKNSRIIPIESINVEPIPYELAQAKQLALEHRPDYRSTLLGVESSRISLMLAKNNQLWDLSLTAGYGQNYARYGGAMRSNSDNELWSAGLRLSIPFGDMTIYQGYLNASISLEKLELGLVKQQEAIEIEVQDRMRDAEMKMRQVKLARLALQLSEKKVEVETEKLKVGRSTNFQLVSYQNDLVNAQNNELNSIINYLNALTSIERTLGITLDRWGIAIIERHGE